MKSILIYMYDHFMRDSLGDLLRHEGYNVIPAFGMKNLNVIKLMNPDLILSDAVMPWMDTNETLSYLKSDESTRNIKIVFIDSTIDPASRESLRVHGADAIITLPFSIGDMLNTVSNVLRA